MKTIFVSILLFFCFTVSSFAVSPAFLEKEMIMEWSNKYHRYYHGEKRYQFLLHFIYKRARKQHEYVTC